MTSWPRIMISPIVCPSRGTGVMVAGSMTSSPRAPGSTRPGGLQARPLVHRERVPLLLPGAHGRGPVDLGQAVDVRDANAELGHALQHSGRRRCRRGHHVDPVVEVAALLRPGVDQHAHDHRRTAGGSPCARRWRRRSPPARPGADTPACPPATPPPTGSTSRCSGTWAASTGRSDAGPCSRPGCRRSRSGTRRGGG